MSASLEFGILQVPPGIANLSFRIAAPRDWNAPDLPADDGTGWIQSLRSKARLRNQDVGFVPNLLEMDAETAKLGVGALRGLIKVALGWHVIEDGPRLIVLDPGGRIQIHLNLMAQDGRDVDEILDEIQAEAAQSYPHPEFRRRQEGQICRLSVENISVDHEPIEQAHLLPPWAHDSAFVRIRVTADPASMQYAIYYAEAIVNNFEYGHPDSHQQDSDQVSGPAHHEPDSGPAPDPPEIGPEFFRRARRLEREDRLKEAEQLIRDSIPTLHSAIATADLYRERWIRLRASHPAKGEEARQQAADWARTYASWATSGGEGAALSLERDEFLRLLEL